MSISHTDLLTPELGERAHSIICAAVATLNRNESITPATYADMRQWLVDVADAPRSDEPVAK